jgi:hypothetical protein
MDAPEFGRSHQSCEPDGILAPQVLLLDQNLTHCIRDAGLRKAGISVACATTAEISELAEAGEQSVRSSRPVRAQTLPAGIPHL